jgi:signal transduction histidine kinase
LTVLVVAATLSINPAQNERWVPVAFLVLMAFVLNQLYAPLERGHLTLSAIPCQVAAAVTGPLATALVLLTSVVVPAFVGLRNRTFAIFALPAVGVLSAGLRTVIAPWMPNATARFVLAIGTYTLLNWIVTAVGLSIRSGESAYAVWRKNLSVAWIGAFLYFAVSALIIAELLDGSLRGYLLAGGVAVLALALTDTLSGRRRRAILEAQLSDADRHLAYTRAVEGVIHAVRNYIGVIVGELQELDARRKAGGSEPLLTTIRSAADDAAASLRSLSAGASPRVRLATAPISLRDVGSEAASLARPIARAKRVLLSSKNETGNATIRGDPLLLREVTTNLLLNAIDAAPEAGSVILTTGLRPNGWPFLSVADNGPGFPEESRNRLFEPHFTTKPNGTGMGLFTSYGIVREHQGQLLYEGSKRGGVFTVLIPPAGS